MRKREREREDRFAILISLGEPRLIPCPSTYIFYRSSVVHPFAVRRSVSVPLGSALDTPLRVSLPSPGRSVLKRSVGSLSFLTLRFSLLLALFPADLSLSRLQLLACSVPVSRSPLFGVLRFILASRSLRIIGPIFLFSFFFFFNCAAIASSSATSPDKRRRRRTSPRSSAFASLLVLELVLYGVFGHRSPPPHPPCTLSVHSILTL